MICLTPPFYRILLASMLTVVLACGHEPVEQAPAWVERVEAPAADAQHLRRASTESQPDVVLITIDTLRADATGFSGAGKVKTPHMDRLATEGVVFTQAHAHAVTTLPSHASMLTGLLPYEHGVRDNAGFVLGEESLTLAEHMAAAGYSTGAFISAFPLDARFGLDRGFETYDDQYQGFAKRDFVFPERPAGETVQRALDWYLANPDGPRFLWLHLFTPHFPYEPEAPFDVQYAEAPYYGEAATVDARLEPLLSAIQQDPDRKAVVVLTSDHGEGLGEHGELTHGTFAYEGTLHIPFVIWAPNLLNPGVVDFSARHIDIFPTVSALAGLPQPSGVTGRDLFAPLPPGADDGHYFEALMTHLNHGWAPLFGRIDGGYKAINLPRPELYDLNKDPREAHNLIEKMAPLHAALLEPLPDMFDALIQRRALSAEEMEQLRSLGYAVSEGSSSQNDVDPKDMIAADQRLKTALGHYYAGRVRQAVTELYGIIEDVPSFEPAYRDLTYILQALGRVPEAAALLAKAQNSGLETEALARRYANVLTQLGRYEEALAQLSAWRESPDPDTHRTLGKVLTGMQAFTRAEEAFQRALDLDETNPEAHVDMGVLYLTMGEIAAAQRHFQLALQEDANNSRAWNGAGIVAARQQKRDDAEQFFRKAFAADDAFIDGYVNLARILIGDGRVQEAQVTLKKALTFATGPQRQQVETMLAQLASP